MAALGAILAGGSWRPWYAALRKPRLSVPLPAFAVVAALVYALDEFTAYRLKGEILHPHLRPPGHSRGGGLPTPAAEPRRVRHVWLPPGVGLHQR
jgi:hypothetical protein